MLPMGVYVYRVQIQIQTLVQRKSQLGVDSFCRLKKKKKIGKVVSRTFYLVQLCFLALQEYYYTACFI